MGAALSLAGNGANCDAFALRVGSLAPNRARHRVRGACRRAKASSGLAENAALVAGELVTTSLCEARGPVRVEVTAGPSKVVIRVSGSGNRRAHRAETPVGALRRWDVVRSMSRSYGYRSTGRGRELWAVLGAPDR